MDGDHFYAGCYRDLVTCHTLVKPCGIRAAHDFGSVVQRGIPKP